jgi:hypothetical protein
MPVSLPALRLIDERGTRRHVAIPNGCIPGRRVVLQGSRRVPVAANTEQSVASLGPPILHVEDIGEGFRELSHSPEVVTRGSRSSPRRAVLAT